MADIFTSKEVDTQEKIRKTKRLATFMVRSAVYHPINPENPDQVRYTILRLLESKRVLENPQAIFVKPLAREYEPDSCLKNDQERPFATTLLTESQKESSPGDLTIVVPGKQYAWGRLTNVVVDEEKNQVLLNVARWSHNGGSRYYLKETGCCSHFSECARIAG